MARTKTINIMKKKHEAMMNAAAIKLSGLIWIIVLLWFVFPSVSSASVVEIKLPITSQNNQRDTFQISLLKLVLEKAGADFKITFAPVVYSQARIIHELKTGSDKINLYWMGTSDELEKDLRPIRFPVYRGLLGYRAFYHQQTAPGPLRCGKEPGGPSKIDRYPRNRMDRYGNFGAFRFTTVYQ